MLGFIPAVEVNRVLVVTTLEVTEVEEAEVVSGDSVGTVTEEELSVGVVEDTTVSVEVITVVLMSPGVVEEELSVFV